MCGFSKSSRLASMSKPGKDRKGVDDVCLFFAVKSSLPPAWSLQHHSRRRPHTSAPPLHELGNASLGTGHGASGSLGAVKLLVGYGSTLKTWETIDLRQFLVLMMQWLGYPIWTHCQWKHGHFTTMVIILRRQWMGWSDGGKPCPHRRSSPADSSSSGSWFRTNWPGENQQSTTENWKPETYWKLTGNHWTIDNSPQKYPPIILILWKWPKIPPPQRKTTPAAIALTRHLRSPGRQLAPRCCLDHWTLGDRLLYLLEPDDAPGICGRLGEPCGKTHRKTTGEDGEAGIGKTWNTELNKRQLQQQENRVNPGFVKHQCASVTGG